VFDDFVGRASGHRGAAGWAACVPGASCATQLGGPVTLLGQSKDVGAQSWVALQQARQLFLAQDVDVRVRLRMRDGQSRRTRVTKTEKKMAQEVAFSRQTAAAANFRLSGRGFRSNAEIIGPKHP